MSWHKENGEHNIYEQEVSTASYLCRHFIQKTLMIIVFSAAAAIVIKESRHYAGKTKYNVCFSYKRLEHLWARSVWALMSNYEQIIKFIEVLGHSWSVTGLFKQQDHYKFRAVMVIFEHLRIFMVIWKHIWPSIWPFTSVFKVTFEHLWLFMVLHHITFPLYFPVF